MKNLAVVLLFLFSPVLARDFPWSNGVPASIREASVLPDRVLDEAPCNWRPVLTPIVRPMVSQCTTAAEAVRRLASGLSSRTGVHYSTARRKHNMNALEALEEKKVSCTGQSILLVCALRAVDIPARAVGVLTWNHIEGNHTWVEAWFDGQWHMIEFNEQDFNTPWVMENIGMLDTRHPLQRIRAATPTGSTSWVPDSNIRIFNNMMIPAEDVTDRYLELARRWYERSGVPADTQRLLIDARPRRLSPPQVELANEQGKVIGSATLPSTRDDMRYFARLSLPRQGSYTLRVQGESETLRIQATHAPVRILRLTY